MDSDLIHIELPYEQEILNNVHYNSTVISN